MTKLFVGLLFVWSSYTVAVIIGSILTNLIRVPTTFDSIWGVMLVLVISSFIASSTSSAGRERTKRANEEDHSEMI